MLQERFIWTMYRNDISDVHQGVNANVTATLIPDVTLEHNSDPVDEIELSVEDKRYDVPNDESLREIIQIYKSKGNKSSYEEYAEKHLTKRK